MTKIDVTADERRYTPMNIKILS